MNWFPPIVAIVSFLMCLGALWIIKRFLRLGMTLFAFGAIGLLSNHALLGDWIGVLTQLLVVVGLCFLLMAPELRTKFKWPYTIVLDTIAILRTFGFVFGVGGFCLAVGDAGITFFLPSDLPMVPWPWLLWGIPAVVLSFLAGLLLPEGRARWVVLKKS